MLLQSLKQEIIKSRFKVCEIWSLNLAAIVGKFGPNDVFIAIEKEITKSAYQLDVAKYSSNNGNEVEVATNLLNIASIFQMVPTLAPTTSTSPSKLYPCLC